MKETRIGAATVMALALAMAAVAQEKPAEKAPEKPAAETAKKEAPKPEQSSTQRTVTIAGVPVSYTATVGTLILRNDKDEPWASMGYTAYVRRDAGGASRRPITFAYNGGPGSSSVWLHLGALGPRRIVTADAASTPPPPYQLVDNAYSIIDKTDLVMIDPVGTGYSRARRRGQGQGLLGRGSGHQVGVAVHQAVRQRQRPLELAQVPPRGELRIDAFGRHRGPATDRRRHVLQRRDPRLGGARHRGDLRRSAETTGRIRSSCRPSRRPPGITRFCRRSPRIWSRSSTRCASTRSDPTAQRSSKGDALSDTERKAVAEKASPVHGIVGRLHPEGEPPDHRRAVQPGAAAGAQRDRRAARLTLPGREPGPAGQGSRLRSAGGRDLGRLHGGPAVLLQRGVEVRPGQDLS